MTLHRNSKRVIPLFRGMAYKSAAAQSPRMCSCQLEKVFLNSPGGNYVSPEGLGSLWPPLPFPGLENVVKKKNTYWFSGPIHFKKTFYYIFKPREGCTGSPQTLWRDIAIPRKLKNLFPAQQLYNYGNHAAAHPMVFRVPKTWVGLWEPLDYSERTEPSGSNLPDTTSKIFSWRDFIKLLQFWCYFCSWMFWVIF